MSALSSASLPATRPSRAALARPPEPSTTLDNAEPVALSWRDGAACLLLSAVLATAGWIHCHSPVCGESHDDAIYVTTAKALAEGEGYRQMFLPGAPPQTKYPPLYPALLAGLWKLWPDFPANLMLLKGLSLVCGAAA